MKQDLASWIRGETTQESGALAYASGLRLPIAVPPEEPAENVADSEKMDTKIKAEPDEKTEQAEEEISETETAAPSEYNLEVEKQTIAPDREPSEYEMHDENEDDKDNYGSYEKRPAWELLEEAGSRLATRLRHIKDTKRVSNTYKRSGFREHRIRFFTICVIAIIVGGTLLALYRNAQQSSYGAMMARAQELFAQEQYTAALEAFNETSRRFPHRSEPFLGIAHSAERMGRVEEAITAYRLSLERFPADAAHLRSQTFHEIGRLYSMLRAWDRAQESFEEAIAADVANFSAYFSLGNSLEEQDQLDEALLAYKQALDLSPSSDAAREAIRRVSLVLSTREEIERVEQRFQQAVQSGEAALEDERFREASDYFAAALAIYSDDASAWVGFGEARFRLGDTAGAVRSMERALERDPEYERAKSRLAEIEEHIRRSTPQRRNNPRSRSRRPTRNNAPEEAPAVLARTTLFDAAVELFRKGEYEASFNSFVACLRSPEREPLPSAPLAGSSGPAWKGSQVRLNVPLDARLLAETVRLNPTDRDLYVNIAMAGARMSIDRQAMRSTMSEARSHALLRAGSQ